MLYITGDLHGDVSRLAHTRKLKKGDTLLVLGDFGVLWYGDKRDERTLKWLKRRKYTILFLDGVHENYNLLDAVEETEYGGAPAGKLADNIFHLLRGEIYKIEGKTVFAFGGGDAENEWEFRTDTHSEREMPSGDDMSRGYENLAALGNKVDIMATHSPSGKANGYFAARHGENARLRGVHVYLNRLEDIVTFDHWYFGSLHADRPCGSRHTAVFEEILKVE